MFSSKLCNFIWGGRGLSIIFVGIIWVLKENFEAFDNFREKHKATPIKCYVSGWVVSSTVMRAGGLLLLILLWVGVACKTKSRNYR